MADEIWHRGWLISKSFFGWYYQHPSYDPENDLNWRHGTAKTADEARAEIDAGLVDEAEWTAAADMLKAARASVSGDK